MLNDKLLAHLQKLRLQSQQSALWQYLQRRLPINITIVLSILALHSLANLTWQLIPKPTLSSYQAPVKTSPATVNKTRQISALQISHWQLFGKPEQPKLQVNPIVKTADIKEANLDLKLKGITYSSHNNQSFAIIADHSGKEKNYKTGQQLPGNAKIEQILKNSVILIHNNERVKLQLKKTKPDPPKNL